MDIESILSTTIFFNTIKDGSCDYTTPMKSSLTRFDIDKSYEPSQSLFEYLCYKIIKNKIKEGQINTETILITEKFLTSFNCKKIFLKSKAIHKKHIIIFLQNKMTLKWNLLIFLNLEEQIKNCFDETKKQPITAKIISSNSNSEEDDYVLNSTMDKLENTFDFKSPDDIQFEVDSINISDQPNTCIFLLNFIEGLIVQNDENMALYIKKLYDEGSNTTDINSRNYFNSFNILNEHFENIYIKYQNELNEYCKKNKNIIMNFDAEKIMNGNNEIFNIENNTDINEKEIKNIEDNETINGGNEIVNGMNKINLDKNSKKLKDDIDIIKLEQDEDIDNDDLNSDEEEEALKIMERENEEAKSQLKGDRKLRQRLYKQKLRLKNLNMYKEFGVIKEEDNESESESIELFSKLKEEKEKKALNESIKKTLLKSIEEKKNKIIIKNNKKDNPEDNTKLVLNTEENNNINNKNDEINYNYNYNYNDIEKEKRSKSEKSIKLSILRDLEEAIEEFELEQESPVKNKESKNINLNINNKKKKENKGTFEKKIEKKSSVRNENMNDEHKKGKKYINIFKESLNKDSFEIKKRSSIPKKKEKEKEINEDDKDKILFNKNSEKLKKSFTNTKKNDKDKNKEKKIEDAGIIKKIKLTNLTQKKSFSSKDSKESKDSKDNNNKNNKSSKSNNAFNITKSKDIDNISNISSNTTNNYISSSFISNNTEDKSSKDKESKNGPKDNNTKKNLINSNTKSKNLSKSKNEQNPKKIISKKSNEKLEQPPLLSKISVSSQKSSSSNRSNDSNPKNSERNTMKKKNKSLKEIEIKIEKNKVTDFSSLDSPLNVLPPQKIVERNNDLNNIEDKYKIENGNNIDINSVQSEKNNWDYSSNINIENMFSDDFESEKNDRYEIKDEGSFLGERTKKTTMIRKGDKKSKKPPGKSRTMAKSYNYCNYDEDGSNKICGCIGEQSNGICFIF